MAGISLLIIVSSGLIPTILSSNHHTLRFAFSRKMSSSLITTQLISLVCLVDAMEEEELCTGPAGVLLAESGGCACFLV